MLDQQDRNEEVLDLAHAQRRLCDHLAQVQLKLWYSELRLQSEVLSLKHLLNSLFVIDDLLGVELQSGSVHPFDLLSE